MAKTVESESDLPVTRRLVVRVKIPVQDPPPPAPGPRRPSRGVLALTVVAAAIAVLGWLGVRMFRAEPASVPAATASAAKESLPRSESRPAVTVPVTEPAPQPAVAPVETTSAEQPAKSPSAVHEVIPDVPRSARDTIRGTIRVSVRVSVDKQGAVLDATADEPGPSRYFARLATEAARKWTFAPTDSAAPRVMLVRFYFKRTGTTARSSPAP